MKKILAFILTPVFHTYYGLSLLFFHPILVVCLLIGGDSARKKAVDILNLILVKGLCLLGSKAKFIGFDKAPLDRPLIIVSNHQSMFDIPAVIWGFRKNYPRFISKKELAKNIPSVSHNLKYGKSALIDRENGSQAVKEIFKLGRLIESNKHSACIFPEGTRSKTGKLRKFKTAGIQTLLRAAPSALIVPLAINGHSQLMNYGSFSFKFGQKVRYTALPAIDPVGLNIEELVEKAYSAIQNELTEK